MNGTKSFKLVFWSSFERCGLLRTGFALLDSLE